MPRLTKPLFFGLPLTASVREHPFQLILCIKKNLGYHI